MEDIRRCPKCSFKSVKSQLYKKYGKCPRDTCDYVWKDIQAETGVI